MTLGTLFALHGQLRLVASEHERWSSAQTAFQGLIQRDNTSVRDKSGESELTGYLNMF